MNDQPNSDPGIFTVPKALLDVFCPGHDRPIKTLDWEALRKYVAEHRPAWVVAGILEDWSRTAATVYLDGDWFDADQPGGAWVESNWGTPGIEATFDDGHMERLAMVKLP